VPVDLVIDHSVQVDVFGTQFALMFNAEREFERNRERYEFLRWGQEAFENFSVVPPATGIVHQVNLEFLAKVVQRKEMDGETIAYPDTLVGTDSHTTMINGLGVLGWGVGGIEAEAAMLGQPIYMLLPQVVGFRMHGELPRGATATDLVLRVTEMLRNHGVVGKFVEFYGPGLSKLTLADRATIGNMSPEYGATMGFFPVDAETLSYLRSTNRPPDLVDLVERYTKEQGIFRTDDTPDPAFNESLELDLSTVEPSLAGPKLPQERVPLKNMKQSYERVFSGIDRPDNGHRREKDVTVKLGDEQVDTPTHIADGAVVIAAITSCTNTSNPSVMVGAGLLARKAVERGLEVPPWVKTSLAPGSKVVTRYLENAGLMDDLERLRFNVVGYGCTTCIGNSGPLPEEIEAAIRDENLVVTSVLSGNRNFEGRVHPLTRANYLASPPLVIAYALAGTMDIDLVNDPLGTDKDGSPVYLSDIWPSPEEIQQTVADSLDPSLFAEEYGSVYTGNETWNQIDIPTGSLYQWDANSTYIQEPPFFMDITPEVPELKDIHGARVLAMLNDAVITTDHISPAGSISAGSPAADYLLEHGVERRDWNSYGSRRGNHEVMMRGTFANVRLRNQCVPGSEGGVTVYLPDDAASLGDGVQMSIYDAAMKYIDEGRSLIVIGGPNYGTGSSRDWAAKGTILLGVKAVIAESYERIHRSNLIGMGVLPLQFKEGQTAESLGLTGFEVFDITGIEGGLTPKQTVKVTATDLGIGKTTEFDAIARIDSPVEIKYYQNGGILHAVLRDMIRAND
jgi:aconitate hydratase